MAVEVFSWPNLHKRIGRMRGSILVLLVFQAASLSIELPCPVNFFENNGHIHLAQRAAADKFPEINFFI